MYLEQALSRRYHMLDYKTSLSKFKKIEIISSIFSDYNTRNQLQAKNCKKKKKKNPQTCVG